MVFFNFYKMATLYPLGGRQLWVLPQERCRSQLTVGCLVKELFIDILSCYNFMMPDQAEAGSAEEQPARNNPARYASFNSC
jgi:hypothetical protein